MKRTYLVVAREQKGTEFLVRGARVYRFYTLNIQFCILWSFLTLANSGGFSSFTRVEGGSRLIHAKSMCAMMGCKYIK